jgi:hypothetical protein
MRTKNLFQKTFVLFLMLCNSNSFASDREEFSSDSLRGGKLIGIEVGILNDPAPNVFGFGVFINPIEYIRVGLGFGIGIGSSIGCELNYLLFPKSSWTPVLGGGFVHNEGDFLGHFNNDLGYLHAAADFQSEGALNFGAGLNVFLKSTPLPVPYLSVGWFFGLPSPVSATKPSSAL